MVDFPLSLTAQSGKELFNMADSKGMEGDLVNIGELKHVWVQYYMCILNDLFRTWVANLGTVSWFHLEGTLQSWKKVSVDDEFPPPRWD